MGKEVLSYSRHWEVPFQVPGWWFILTNVSSEQIMSPLLSPAVGIGYLGSPGALQGDTTGPRIVAPAPASLSEVPCFEKPVHYHIQLITFVFIPSSGR